jgi:hypothetical protein
MEAGPRLHPVTQRPLTAAPADLRRLPADPRSAAGRQAAQAAAADRLTHLRPLPGRPQASFEHGLVHGEVLNGVYDEGELGELVYARRRWWLG